MGSRIFQKPPIWPKRSVFRFVCLSSVGRRPSIRLAVVDVFSLTNIIRCRRLCSCRPRRRSGSNHDNKSSWSLHRRPQAISLLLVSQNIVQLTDIQPRPCLLLPDRLFPWPPGPVWSEGVYMCSFLSLYVCNGLSHHWGLSVSALKGSREWSLSSSTSTTCRLEYTSRWIHCADIHVWILSLGWNEHADCVWIHVETDVTDSDLCCHVYLPRSLTHLCSHPNDSSIGHDDDAPQLAS